MTMGRFDEVYETLPGNGWLSRDEAELLYRVASEVAGPILEVGSYEGRSTVLLASFGRPVYAVDSFVDCGREAMDRNLAERGITNVRVYQIPIVDWVPDFHVRVPFAYLDGDHTYQGTVDQIEAALRWGAETIVAHDVNDSGGGLEVKRACVELLGAWEERVERLAVWKVTR